jgi:hypothetical protein
LISSCQEADCLQMRPGNSSIRFLFFASCLLFCVLRLVSCFCYLLLSFLHLLRLFHCSFSLFFFSVILPGSSLLCRLSMYALSVILNDITDIVGAFFTSLFPSILSVSHLFECPSSMYPSVILSVLLCITSSSSQNSSNFIRYFATCLLTFSFFIIITFFIYYHLNY